MDWIASKLASVVGASTDQVKVILLVVLHYPLGHLYIRVPTSLPAARHLFSIAVSFYSLGVLKLYTGVAHELFSILGTWVLLPWRHKYMPWAVFFFTMSHLMLNHLYRIWYNITSDDFDITFSQMVLVIKITTLAWSVHDARQPDEYLDKQQRESKVDEFPSLLEYLGYCFYFPGFLVGPALEFKTYRSLVAGTLFTPRDGKPIKAATLLEGRKRAAYWHMGYGFLAMAIWVTFGPRFNYLQVMQDGWEKQWFVKRVVLVQLMGITQRTKYYAAWKLAEGAAILTGLGFNGYNAEGKTLWNRATNVNIWKVEFAPNFKILLDNWNVNTNVWLRNCVYKRVTPRGKKPGNTSTILTFLVSAIWHGSESGYYLTFLQASFTQILGRMMRTCVRPWLLPPVIVQKPQVDTAPPTRSPTPIPPPQHGVSPAPGTIPDPSRPTAAPEPPQTLAKYIYDFLGVICTAMELNYCVAPFILLKATDSIHGWRKMGFYGAWMTYVPLLFFFGGGRAFLLGKLKQRAEREKRRLERKENIPGVVIVPPSPSMKKVIEASDFIAPGWVQTPKAE